jgi:hypothetical protein
MRRRRDAPPRRTAQVSRESADTRDLGPNGRQSVEQMGHLAERLTGGETDASQEFARLEACDGQRRERIGEGPVHCLGLLLARRRR